MDNDLEEGDAVSIAAQNRRKSRTPRRQRGDVLKNQTSARKDVLTEQDRITWLVDNQTEVLARLTCPKCNKRGYLKKNGQYQGKAKVICRS